MRLQNSKEGPRMLEGTVGFEDGGRKKLAMYLLTIKPHTSLDKERARIERNKVLPMWGNNSQSSQLDLCAPPDGEFGSGVSHMGVGETIRIAQERSPCGPLTRTSKMVVSHMIKQLKKEGCSGRPALTRLLRFWRY